MHLRWLVLVFWVTATALTGQALPPVQSFELDTYGGGSQNWAIAQDERGFIYVANHEGLLEYDGERWQLYPSPNESVLRSVAVVGERIYTGFYEDFGYWTADEQGLAYTSLGALTDRVWPDEQFWGIHAIGDQVLFQSLNQLFTYNPATDQLTVTASPTGITKLFALPDAIYLTDGYQQLYRLSGGELSEPLISRQAGRPLIHLWREGDRLLAISAAGETVALVNEGWQPVARMDFLAGRRVYSALSLRNGGVAVGTISDGVYVADASGELVAQMDRVDGLANNTVLSLAEDRDGNLWAGTDNGISLINLTAPLRRYTDVSGQLGTVYAAATFKGRLYLGTNQGLFVQDVEGQRPPALVPGTQAQVWSLLAYDDRLFVGHDRGAFVVRNGEVRLLGDEYGAWGFVPVPGQPDLLLQGSYSGLYVLERKRGVWQLRNRVRGFDLSTRFLVMPTAREVYVSHEYRGVYGLRLNDDLTEVTEERLYEQPGKGRNAGLALFQDSVYYYSREGLFVLEGFAAGFTRRKGALVPVTDQYVSGKMVAEGDRLWQFSQSGISYLRPAALAEGLEQNVVPLAAELVEAKSGYENLANLGGDTLLIGTADGYLLLDLSKLPDYQHQLFLTEAQALPADREPFYLPAAGQEVELPHYAHNLRFALAVPNYDRYFTTQYQHRLLGLTEAWSDWRSSAEVSFSELPAGDYTLEVRSRVGLRESDNTISYPFTVRRPWYGSYPALGIYVLALLGAGWLINRLSQRKYARQQAAEQAKTEARIAAQQRQAELELTRLNNERLKEDVESKSRELALVTMNMVKKNELLRRVKEELAATKSPERNIRQVVKTIDHNMDEGENWKMFKDAFENADREFFTSIKEKHPDLTPNDLKLCAYLRLNLSSKEIAPMLNISPRSVEVKRYRLRKKLGLAREVNLTEYIMSL